MSKAPTDAADFLPLKPEVFEILMRVVREPCHGYAIMRDVAAATGGDIDMLPGTLYRHLRWMLSNELIAESGRKPAAGDQRRRVYRTTELGTAAARLEAGRLAERVAAAREIHLISDDPR